MNEEKRLNKYHWVVFEIAYFVGNPIAKKYWGGEHKSSTPSFEVL